MSGYESSASPRKPLYSGAPDLNWVPSSRVLPNDTADAPPLAVAAPAPAAPAAPELRDWLKSSASRFRTRVKLAFQASAPQAPAQPPVVEPVLRRPEPRPLPLPPSILERQVARPANEPLEVPIGTSVSLAEVPATGLSEPPVVEEAIPVEATPETTEMAAPEAASEPVAETPAWVVAAEAPVDEPAIEVAPATSLEAVVPAAEPAVAAEAPSVTWQVLILSGPAGAGKSSVAQALAQVLPKLALVKVESLRDRAFSTVVAQTLPRGDAPVGSGPLPAMWMGQTAEARANAVRMAQEYVGQGAVVLIEDAIETATDLQSYLSALAPLAVKAVTLIPSLEEMELRDKMLPTDLQAGIRVAEARQSVMRQLKELTVILDTSEETVESTAARILEQTA